MKVSILCMAFNHEKYIRNALEGFVNQKTDFDYEVIIHDDASTDGTADIIREYAEKYPHLIRAIYQTENKYSQRVDIVRSIMVPVAEGEYYAICEGDDYWTDENKLQLQVDILDRNPGYSACVHNCRKLDLMTGEQTVMYPEEDRDLGVPDVLQGGSCCYQTASLVCRREAFAEFPPFLPGFFDYPFSIHLAILGPIRYLGRVMSVYNVGTASSWTTANRKDMRKNAIFHNWVSKMLKLVDEYTGFAYREQIAGLVLYNDYKALYFEEKYAEMRKPEFRRLYSQESLSSRVKMRLKQYFAPLYHQYRKRKYGAP